MYQPQNGKFSKDVIYYTNATLKKFASEGNLYSYSLWLLLKRQYVSGHIHNNNIPSFYKKSKSQFYRDINKLVELGLATREHGKGIRLSSLKSISGLSRQQFNPQCHIHSGTTKQLQYYFQKQIIQLNYNSQLKNIILKELGYDWCDLKISQGCRRMFNKVLRVYATTQRAYEFTKKTAKNKTSLGVRKTGKLFGKSSYYGKMLFRKLINEGFLTRFIYFIKQEVKYNTTKIRNLFINHNPEYLFSNGGFYKVITTFIINTKSR